MQVQTFLDIAAPPARVWAVLADFAGWDRWNPVLTRVRGRLEVGAHVRFRVATPRGPALPISAEIVIVEPGRDLTWIGPAAPRWLRKVVAGEHWFRLTPIATGTRFDHGERFTGAALPARWDRFEQMLTASYDAMNRALAREVERAAPTATTSASRN